MKRVISNSDSQAGNPTTAQPPTESTVVSTLPWQTKNRTQVFASDGKTPVAQFYSKADADHCVACALIVHESSNRITAKNHSQPSRVSLYRKRFAKHLAVAFAVTIVCIFAALAGLLWACWRIVEALQ